LKAAGQLRVAQSALSKQIRDLEREVGVALFERLSRGVRLTAAGEVFLAEARATLERAAGAVAGARRADQRRGSSLHLAHGEVVVWAPVIADLLAAFRAAHPTVEVRVSNLDEVETYAALRERRVDVAVLFVLGWPVEGFDGHRLVSFEASGVLLPASHPLAVKQTIHLSELRDLTFLHLAGQHWPLIYGSIHRALRERGLVPARVRAVSIDSASVHLAAGPLPRLNDGRVSAVPRGPHSRLAGAGVAAGGAGSARAPARGAGADGLSRITPPLWAASAPSPAPASPPRPRRGRGLRLWPCRARRRRPR